MHLGGKKKGGGAIIAFPTVLRQNIIFLNIFRNLVLKNDMKGELFEK